MTQFEEDFMALNLERSAEFLGPGEIPEDNFAEDPEYDNPDTSLVNKKARSPKARAYEKKVRSIFQTAHASTVLHPKTLPDAAAILMHAPAISEKGGDLAASNEAFARAVDFIAEGSENPTASFIFATVPLALQIFRNHEPTVETPTGKGLRIPFTKKEIKLRFGLKLGNLRPLTNDPDALIHHVYGNPDIVTALKEQGIDISDVARRRRASA